MRPSSFSGKRQLIFLLLALLLLCFMQRISGELVAALILPHGDFALDPALLPENSEARKAAEQVSAAARVAGSWLSETIQADLIMISTPHGMELTNDFAFYMGSSASGYADIGQDLHKNGTSSHRVKLDRISLAPNETRDLIDNLQGQQQAVSGILNFADSEDMALRWGEVIPLLLLGSVPQTSTRRRRGRRRHMILSHPLRRYTQSPAMVSELLELGHSILKWAETRPERIALLISADLSHTHQTDGPYGYSNTSAPFDAAIQHWATDPIQNADSILKEATSLQDQGAMSCGFTGMVMLHGCLVAAAADDGQSYFTSKVLAMRNATYYGMMVATFAKQNPEKEGFLATSHKTTSVS